MFRRRTQSQCESITEYIAALRDLASTCDFGDFLEDAICDQMIEKMYNHKIRERLLADENIDLDKAIVIAVRLENAIRDAKSMDPHRLSDDFDKSVNVVKYNKHYMRKEKLVAEIQSMINRRIRRRVTDVVPHNTKRTIHNARLCNRNVENVTKSDISKKCAFQREQTFMWYNSYTMSHKTMC